MFSQATGALRAAFVMEQALGHVTHASNLRAALAERTDIAPSWLPIPFDAHGAARLVPLLRSNWSVRASWRARRALDRALARDAHRALLFHTQVTALFSTSLMRRIPSIVSMDATPINYDSVGAPYGHRAAGDGWLDRQKYRMNRDVFHAAARLITWSEWARTSLIDDYGVDPDRIRVLAPGAAASYFALGDQRVLRPAPRADTKVRLLFVGGNFDRKGGPLLLDSLQGSLAERCEVDIVTQDQVPARPGVRVHHGLGPNSPELGALYANADLFVLASRAECLAVVLMEATAAALPVITTDVGALAEAVVPGESGVVIPADDGRALRAAIERLVDDPALRERMGRSGRRLAQRKFDARRNNATTLDLLVEVAHRPIKQRRAA